MKRALALLLAAVAAPCFAQDFRTADTSVLYFVNVPLGAQSRAERDPSLGFALQGKRTEQPFRMQLPLMKFSGGVIEAKYLILGAAAAGVAAVAGGSDKSAEAQRQQQAEAAAEIATNGPAPCPEQPGQCFAFGSRRYHFIRF